MLRRETALAAVFALSVVLAACGGSVEPATETPAAPPSASDTPRAEPTPAGDASAGDTMDVAEHLREKTMRMWEVYNSYDLDALKAFYEEGYWNEQEEELRSNMAPFQRAGATITAEETSPPTEIAPGKWRIEHVGRFAMGSVNMVFVYEEFGGEWLLTHAEAE